MNTFKCVESDEHVKQVGATAEDVLNIYTFIQRFEIPVSMTRDDVKRECEGTDIYKCHEMIHRLLDDVVTAYKAGHPSCQDRMLHGDNLMEEIVRLQDGCRTGIHKS